MVPLWRGRSPRFQGSMTCWNIFERLMRYWVKDGVGRGLPPNLWSMVAWFIFSRLRPLSRWRGTSCYGEEVSYLNWKIFCSHKITYLKTHALWFKRGLEIINTKEWLSRSSWRSAVSFPTRVGWGTCVGQMKQSLTRRLGLPTELLLAMGFNNKRGLHPPAKGPHRL